MATTTSIERPPVELLDTQKLRKGAQTTVAVVGLGYVGMPFALLLAERGYRVVGYDIDSRRVDALRERRADFLTNEERDRLHKVSMTFSTSAQNMSGADIFVVCVPTPVHEDHTPDLEPLESACRAVGMNLEPGALVIIESTVNPGVCENVALSIITELSGLTVEEDFYFAHCPERVNPGDPKYVVGNIPRVLGASGPRSLMLAAEFYRSVLDAPIHEMHSIKEAEAVKMVENSFRDINIAFVNELAMSFDRAGIDITEVIRGASTKPFGFMAHYPGCGVGGHCIPVDPYYLIRYGRENGFEHQFLLTARNINNRMPRYTVELLKEELIKKDKSLEGARIALLGLAYKKDIPDLRESPALEIAQELAASGAEVRRYDPLIPHQSTVLSLERALSHADAAILATDHTSIISELTPELLVRQHVPIIIDGRNKLSKDSFLRAGIAYRGIGR